MKPLLRTLLAINAVIVLLFGLLFLLTPWLSMYSSVASFASSPALIGQLLGVFLLGFAGLQINAAGNGRLTAGVGRWAGHTLWLAALVLLVWDIALRQPDVDRSGDYAVPFIGVVLLLLGIIQSRVSGLVAVRERRERIGEVSARRAEKNARRDGAAAANAAMTSERAGPLGGDIASKSTPYDDGEPYVGTSSTLRSPASTSAGAQAQAVRRSEDEQRQSVPPVL